MFSGRIILKRIENKNDIGGSGGMFPQKIFENLRAAVDILVLFEQLLGKFFASNLSVSPNMIHFAHTFSIMRD